MSGKRKKGKKGPKTKHKMTQPSKGPFQQLIEHQPPLGVQELRARRIQLIKQIQAERGRPLVIYATNPNVNQRVPAMIHREDIVPFSETLDSVTGKSIDVLIETPGGLAEVTVELVNLLRPRFDDVAFIVPHTAMSAGTILVMSGDEILMDHRSSLGAIDPQFQGSDGRLQPAQAILAGIEAIKDDVLKNGGNLNPVYLPILRNVDPGKLQSAINASQLSQELVTNWLAGFKFRKWLTHSSTGQPVTDDERRARAAEIAKELCDHQKWLSHGRPIKLSDLEQMRLKITDYGKTSGLQKLIWDLWVNLSHSLSSTNIYKVYESETVEFFKIALPQPPQMPAPAAQPAGKARVDLQCDKCGTPHSVQANFGAAQPLEPGAIAFPKDCMLRCRGCNNVLNLTGLKLQLEAQLRRPLVL